MLLLALALAAGSAPADTLAPLAPAGMVVVHRQPSLPIVALRLSVLADDPPGHAGAGHLVQHLALPSLREQVLRVGGEVHATRTTDAVVYTVIGPAAETDYLAGVLRSALEPPRFAESHFIAATRELTEERNAEWENAAAHTRSLLRARLFSDDLSPAGTPASAARLTAEAIPGLWGRMYRPERVAVVAVGDVELPRVRAAFANLPDASGEEPAEPVADTVAAEPLASPEATRGWIGLGYSAPDADPAAMTVLARLLGGTVRQRVRNARVESEHWWTRSGQAVVLLVAAPPTALAGSRQAVRGSVSALRERLDEDAVRNAAAGVRRDMLFYARTPERMAEVVGQFVDRAGDAEAAQRFYAAVERLTADDVRALLDRLAEETPVLVEIPPQKLPNRSP